MVERLGLAGNNERPWPGTPQRQGRFLLGDFVTLGPMGTYPSRLSWRSTRKGNSPDPKDIPPCRGEHGLL